MTDPITAARALIEPLTGHTKGTWSTPFDAYEYGWSLDTEGENTYQAIGTERGPVAITGVDSAWGRDALVKANARLIASAPDLRDMVATLADALEEERDQALARLALAQREMRDRAAQVLDEDYSIGGVNTELDRRICCNGQMCGCMGATVGHYLQHQIRTLEPIPDAQAALDKLLAEARSEGWRAGRDAAARYLEAHEYSVVGGAATMIPSKFPEMNNHHKNAARAIRALPEPKEASHG